MLIVCLSGCWQLCDLLSPPPRGAAVLAFCLRHGLHHELLLQVYNYWEPLHFILYGSGMQTWEYR